MLWFHANQFRWVLALVLGIGMVGAEAQEYRYHYVSFNEIELPSGFTKFVPAAIQDSGRVYGILCNDTSCSVAFYKDGIVTIQSSGFNSSVVTVNAGGTVGGGVVVDSQNFLRQAALFRGDEVELIPPQPGETDAVVISLNDPGTALVKSNGQQRYVLYSKGQTTPLDFGPTITRPYFYRFALSDLGGRFINNEGVIAGITIPPTGDAFDGARGFRFDPRTGKAMILEPVPPDTLAWGLSINNRGDVLGYSFASYPEPYNERIGVWDRNGQFKTYFDEDTTTTFSQTLLFNDNNLIVITFALNLDDPTRYVSYLVPKPGVRLNLADLVENLPSGRDLRLIISINNHGDMIGFDEDGINPSDFFLLERIGGE